MTTELAPTKNKPARYRAEIDGLRAVAVMAVLFFHADLGFTGGYVGVDVFFVISGFLITGLILKDLDRGRFSILEFWERRVRRILPALAVVVASCLVAGWFLFLPRDYKELGQSAVAQSLLVSNLYFWRESGYFAQAASVKPLLHTWSLAVEEQFYLLFPFMLMAIYRFSRKSLVPAILLLGCGSFGLSVFCSYRYPEANFYLLPMRAWELLIGAFLAAAPAKPSSHQDWVNESLGFGGLFAILYAAIAFDRETRFPGAAALIPCAGAALVVWSCSGKPTAAGKLLSARPMVFIGLISYSLYLWHWPALVFFKYWYWTLGPIPAGQRALLLIASAALAVLTWKFVETPFRKRRFLASRLQVFGFAGCTGAALFFGGLMIHSLQGMPKRLPAEAALYADGKTDHASRKDLGLKEAVNGNFEELGTRDKQAPIDLFVWGDSHAMAAMPVLDLLCKERAVRGVAAVHSATAPLIGYKSLGQYSLKDESLAFGDAVLTAVRSKAARNVLLIANWNGYINKDNGTDLIRDGLLATINALQSSGADVWIMRDVPTYRWDVPDTLAIAALRGAPLNELGSTLADYNKQSERQNSMFDSLAAQFPRLVILNPAPCFLDASDRCRVAKDGRALYCDEEHLSTAGAMLLRPLFEPIFAGIDKDQRHSGNMSASR